MKRKPFVISRPVRVRTYLSELLLLKEATITGLKVNGELKSYHAEDVREFLTENPVYLQRAIAELHDLSKPRAAVAVDKGRKLRSKQSRG